MVRSISENKTQVYHMGNQIERLKLALQVSPTTTHSSAGEQRSN